MIKFAYKIYLRFPPLARTAVDLSLGALMGSITIDYSPQSENILIGADEIINKKLFS